MESKKDGCGGGRFRLLVETATALMVASIRARQPGENPIVYNQSQYISPLQAVDTAANIIEISEERYERWLFQQKPEPGIDPNAGN